MMTDGDRKGMSIVEEAESVIGKLSKDNKGEFKLTMTQLRKFLSAVISVKNKIDISKMKALQEGREDFVLSDKEKKEVQFLEINLIYQMSRDSWVQEFGEHAKLKRKIREVENSPGKFYALCEYVEALVAVYKFMSKKQSN